MGFLIQGPVRLLRWRDAPLLHRRPGDDIEIGIGHGLTSSLLRPPHIWRHFGNEKLKHESRLGRAASVDERGCAILGRQYVPAVPKSRDGNWRSRCHAAHIMCASTPIQEEACDERDAKNIAQRGDHRVLYGGGRVETTALAAKGRVDEAKSELAELEKVAASGGDGSLERVKAVLAVAVLNAKARITAAEGNKTAAIGLLREAVAKEDRLAYSEPADWFFPTRHLLGSVLIEAAQAADAEAVYRDDLSRHPDNGCALYGLAQSLRMQGRSAEALRVQQQFDRAWRHADVSLVASAF
jgi:tetratricopeptide (TPR) repeat protein